MGILGDAFDVIGSTIASTQAGSSHPFDSASPSATGTPRTAAPTGLTAASSIRSSDDPITNYSRVLAESSAGFNNSRLRNGPWNARVMLSFKADDPRIPPDTVNPNQRPVPWIVAYIPVVGCAGNSPHSLIPSPIEYRRDGSFEEQRIHWQSLEHLFQVGVFIRGDSNPEGHLPQPNDQVSVTFYDVRNPGLGGIYNSVEHSGYQSPTGLPAPPVCERELLAYSAPSDASSYQAPRPAPIPQRRSPDPVSSASRRMIVDQLISVGDAADNQREAIPNSLLDTIVASGEWGVLTLFVAVANWGVEWGTAPPEDPAGRDWQGPRTGSGKHLRDYLRGGLGIPHIDSGFLRRDTYGRWGRPPGIPDSVLDEYSFDQIRQSQYRDAWRAWAGPLVQSSEFQYWSIDMWIQKTWDPAEATNNTIATRALNARIRNSASGVGGNLTGRSWDAQAQGYLDYKEDGPGSRTMRQINMSRRVAVIAEIYGLE